MLVILLLRILLFLKWWQGHIQELWTQGVASFAPAAGSCMCHWAGKNSVQSVVLVNPLRNAETTHKTLVVIEFSVAVELHCGVKTDGTCQIMSKTDEFEDSFNFVGASLLAHGEFVANVDVPIAWQLHTLNDIMEVQVQLSIQSLEPLAFHHYTYLQLCVIAICNCFYRSTMC